MLIHPEPETFDLVALSEKVAVSPRTIRYYIQQGLLPAPEARGPGAHYGPEHVDLVLLIKRLQKEHLPLSEIRRRIEKLPRAEIRRILQSGPDRPPESASEYVRRVLSEGSGNLKVADSLRPRHMAASMAPMAMPLSASAPPAPPPAPVLRSQWDHFTLAPDVELHVRRPVSREDNRRIERLLDAAREIFKENLP
ncbi:MAG: MerR family transcriptional regulator [Gemmatimonadales bacterium]